MKRLYFVILSLVFFIGCVSTPESPLASKTPSPIITPEPALILDPIEDEEYQIELFRGIKTVVVNKDELTVKVSVIRMGRNYIRFFIFFQNLSVYTMPYRQHFLGIDGSYNGLDWVRLRLMTADETQRLFDSFAIQANKPLLGRECFLYDNDIKPGQFYNGERGYIKDSDPVFNFYRLRIGKDSPQILIFFQRLEEE
jgi:hypothetical protein